MSAPFRIDEGLFLEGEGVLIAWGTPLDGATPLPGNPTMHTLVDRGWAWIWKDRCLFGGIRGTAITRRDIHASFPVFPKGLPTVHCFDFYTPVEPDRDIDVAAISLRKLQRLVRESIEPLGALQRRIHDSIEAAVGLASYSCAGYRFGLPEIVWESEALHVHCHPSNLGNLSLDITVEHHTNDYPELKAEAQRHWARFQSSRPRLDFVAWDCDDPRIPADARSDHRENLARELRRLELKVFQTNQRV